MWEKTELLKNEFQENINYWKAYLRKKAKFLFDENIDLAIVDEIKSNGYKSTHVIDENLKGQPDEKIYNFARQKSLIIVTTNTKHFWPNNKKMPLKTSPGIICLESNPGDINKVLFLLANACYYFGDSAKMLCGTKAKVTEKEIILKIQGTTKIEFMKIDLKTGDFYSKV